MVIRLTSGTDIGGAIRYNEQKVAQKQAHVLGTLGFANNELAARNRNYTTSVLESQSRKNTNVRKPTLHFSLSLHPSEKVSDVEFKAMADRFMAEMGYKNQPYIVYRHYDTAHPHIHIVTTCVDETGAKINDAFIKRRANAVRQKLELQFGLVIAEGRGKTAERLESIESTKTLTSGELQKRDQLETILRQAFEQSTFTTIEEFKELLKKRQVQTTLHQSTREGKRYRGISYQLTDLDGKATTPRIKASEIGAWATWNKVEELFGKLGQTQQEQPQPNRLSSEQYKVLAAFLSDQLREYKKNQRVYYDSTLIENFPTAAMQAALHSVTQKKLTEVEVTEAVRRFEEYKRAQLTEIIQKEQFAFTRTMIAFTNIGSEINGNVLSKIQYFSALSLDVDQSGILTSAVNRHLTYQIDAERWSVIRSETGPDLNIPREYSRGERSVMLLSDSGKPFKESYYDVRSEHLQCILMPDRMNIIHQQLNKNYITKLNKDAPIIGADQVRYFYQRGVMVDELRKSIGEGAPKEITHLVRYGQAPSLAAIAPGEIFANQIPLLNLKNWNQGLSTEAGRYMVALAQCIDRATLSQRDVSTNKPNDFANVRKQILKRDPSLAIYTDRELVTILENRSLQGKGWIQQTEHEAGQEPNVLVNESTMDTRLLDIRAADVFGYEQTGKYKNVGKGIKKRSKEQGRDL